MTKLLIMVAPNGARRTKRDHPLLPMTAEEIGATARDCMRAGASAIHTHVRDGAGVHALDPELYRDAIASISRQCGDAMVIQVTTEAAGLFGVDEQVAAVRALNPACLSLSVREILRGGEDYAIDFLAWTSRHQIAVQFIVYDVADIDVLARWVADDKLPAASRLCVLLVAGRYGGGGDSDIEAFETLFQRLAHHGLDRSATWMTCAFGRGEMACLERTIALGGHVRVGFENAIVDAEGNTARDNQERVALVAGLAERAGRELASPHEAKQILGITR